jgi:hypothetical protein
MAIIPMAKMVNIMATIQSVSPIEIAARNQTRLFIVYVGVLVIGGLAAALLTVLVYRAGSTYQGAVQADADARIAEAGTKAATANERAAVANAQAAKANEGLAKSNEEIARLTKEAETAKTERAEANKQIAIAKADAARAKEGIANAEAVSAKASVEVARLQVVVANAEQKRAEAEKALLELQQQVRARHLTIDQRNLLIKFLNFGPKGEFKVATVLSAPDGDTYSAELGLALLEAGWTPNGKTVSILAFKGVRVYFGKRAESRARHLHAALTNVGIATELITNDELEANAVTLIVGEKP